MSDDNPAKTNEALSKSDEFRAWIGTFAQSPIPGPAKDDAPEIQRRLDAARGRER